MSVSPYPAVFQPNPANERVPGSTPLLPSPYSSSIQAQPGATGATGQRALVGANGQIQFVSSADYDQAMQQVQQAINTANAFDREKFVKQYQDLQAARDNALELEQLRDRTSRYGVDAQTQQAIATREQNARQFDATHALDLQRFGLDQQKMGLDYAKTATDYLSTPDRFAQSSDYVNMAGRVLSGQGGPQPYSTNTFTAKTPADFAALAAGKPLASGAPNYGQSASGNLQADIQGAATSTATDPRTKALKAIVDAVPPSATPGMDPNDWAVASAFKALYGTGQPASGTYQRMSPGQQAITRSEAQRSGQYVPDFVAAQTRNMIGQGSARAA